MITSDKKVRELASKLNDNNVSVIAAAIDDLRDHKPFSGAIGLLAKLHDTTEAVLIKDHIRRFMNDLKESSVRTEIIGEIISPHKPDTLAMLVSSCWQSGLDYSSWAKELAIVFCRADYLTALECFTVLEESAYTLPVEKKKELITILKENDNKKLSEKATLLHELISVLS